MRKLIRLRTQWINASRRRHTLPGPVSFDTNLCWSAARLTDILATLDRALVARGETRTPRITPRQFDF